VKSGIRGVLLIALVSLAACAPQATGSPTTGGPAAPAIKKHVVAGAMGNIVNINSVLAISGSGNNAPGTAELEQLLNAGLSVPRVDGSPETQLAEAVPTVENGLWKVLPDGRMETTWHLRPGIFWQDGEPFTVDDLVFTAQLGQDRELPYGHPPVWGFVSSVEAFDPNTVLVRWKEPYIEADALFGAAGTKPAPKHLLEAPYLENKSNFLSVPFWSSGFVGTGPFKVQEWQEGSFVVIAANDKYVFGRPKIDEIELRFIPDRVALAASILAGGTEVVLGRSLNPEEAVEVARQWQDGTLGSYPSNPNIATPQHLNPDPPIVGNVQFRRALYTAIDRTELANIFTAGFGTAANSGVLPSEPFFDYVEAHVVHYAYDPQRAAQLVEGLGYTRGPDGVFQHNAG